MTLLVLQHRSSRRPRLARLLAGWVTVAAATVVAGAAVLGASPARAATTFGISGRITAVRRAQHSFSVRALVSSRLVHAGGSYVVHTSATTRFVSATRGVASFSALRVGEVVVADVTVSHGAFLAAVVAVAPVPPPGGTVLPAGFPKGVPLPPGYRVVSAESPSAGGRTSFLVALEVPGGAAAVASGYSRQLVAAGFRLLAQADVNGVRSITALGDGFAVAAAISAPRPGQGVPAGDVIVSLNLEPAG